MYLPLGKRKYVPPHHNGQWERSVREGEPVGGCYVADEVVGWLLGLF